LFSDVFAEKIARIHVERALRSEVVVGQIALPEASSGETGGGSCRLSDRELIPPSSPKIP
jgi:hypothetical protein